MAKFVDAKHRLMPYLYNLVGAPLCCGLANANQLRLSCGLQSIHASSKGHPLMRAMFLEFPDDRSAHYLDRQYMLGLWILCFVLIKHDLIGFFFLLGKIPIIRRSKFAHRACLCAYW